MSKHVELTADEMKRFHPARGVLQRLEACRARLGICVREMRVLDYGCGRGRSVAKLREAGYQAFGADIDPIPVGNGRPYFQSVGLDGHHLLRIIGPDGALSFDSRSFHFVFSEQVFEHVRDIDAVVGEIARVTCPDGGGVHMIPGPRQVTEGHLYMPFVHWLPKNSLRRFAIWAMVCAGKEPFWREMQGLPARERANRYFQYSRDKTYYRNWPQVRDAFRRAGFNAECRVPSVSGMGGTTGLLLRAAARLGRSAFVRTYLAIVTIEVETCLSLGYA